MSAFPISQNYVNRAFIATLAPARQQGGSKLHLSELEHHQRHESAWRWKAKGAVGIPSRCSCKRRRGKKKKDPSKIGRQQRCSEGRSFSQIVHLKIDHNSTSTGVWSCRGGERLGPNSAICRGETHSGVLSLWLWFMQISFSTLGRLQSWSFSGSSVNSQRDLPVKNSSALMSYAWTQPQITFVNIKLTSLFFSFPVKFRMTSAQKDRGHSHTTSTTLLVVGLIKRPVSIYVHSFRVVLTLYTMHVNCTHTYIFYIHTYQFYTFCGGWCHFQIFFFNFHIFFNSQIIIYSSWIRENTRTA